MRLISRRVSGLAARVEAETGGTSVAFIASGTNWTCWVINLTYTLYANSLNVKYEHGTTFSRQGPSMLEWLKRSTIGWTWREAGAFTSSYMQRGGRCPLRNHRLHWTVLAPRRDRVSLEFPYNRWAWVELANTRDYPKLYLARMKMNRLLGFVRDEGDLIATFCDAQLVKKSDNKIELIGGSQDDRRALLEWGSLFLRECRLDARPDCKISTPGPY